MCLTRDVRWWEKHERTGAGAGAGAKDTALFARVKAPSGC